MKELSEIQLSALTEVATVGSGHAATSLSQMIGKKIGIAVPHTRIMQLEDVPNQLGGAETLVTAIYCQVVGDVTASMLNMFYSKDALKLVDLLTGKKIGSTRILDEFGRSALRELGNITTGSYLLAMSKLINASLFHSISSLVTDMMGAVLDGILIKLGVEAEHALIMESEIMVGEDIIRGWLLFIPDTEGLNAILESMGVLGSEKADL